EDSGAASRLRANAALLWARYGGAFSDRSWRPVARELMERGLKDAGTEARTFEAAALLLGRAALGRQGMAGWADAAMRNDAERAVEIAEAIDSPHLMSHALDEVAWTLRAEGFCESARMADRTRDAASTMTDRVQAHELLVTAALGFADAGQFDRGAELARHAAQEARQLAPHHRLHAASAQTACLL